MPHATWILGQDAKKDNRYLNWFRPAPSSLVAMSDFLAQQFLRNHHIALGHIIPNGIDPSVFPAANNTRSIDILGAGSLIPLKQFAVFITIVKELSLSFPGLSVTICGDGPEKDRLGKLIREKQLAGTIRLAGELPHHEVLALMQRSRLFLHTSSYEGFSGACLEALYAGAHVVSFCHPQQSWIRHWHIADSVTEITALCKELLEEPGLDHTPVLPYRMSDSARQFMGLFDQD